MCKSRLIFLVILKTQKFNVKLYTGKYGIFFKNVFLTEFKDCPFIITQCSQNYNTLFVSLYQYPEGGKVVAEISFPNIQWSDGGMYTCQASNGAVDGHNQEIQVEETVAINVICKCNCSKWLGAFHVNLTFQKTIMNAVCLLVLTTPYSVLGKMLSPVICLVQGVG